MFKLPTQVVNTNSKLPKTRIIGMYVLLRVLDSETLSGSVLEFACVAGGVRLCCVSVCEVILSAHGGDFVSICSSFVILLGFPSYNRLCLISNGVQIDV